MKIIAPILFSWALILFAQPIDETNPKECPEREFCLAHRDEPLPEPETKKAIETLRIWRLTEELNLTEDQSIKFFPRVKALREAREEFEKNRMKLIGEMAELLMSKTDEKKLKAKIDEFFALEKSFREREDKIRKETANILNTEQQARLIIFMSTFDREVRKLIKEIKGPKGHGFKLKPRR